MNATRLSLCFGRIGLFQNQSSIKPDLETLTLICKHFACHVPFENLDLLAGVPLRIDSKSVFSKIVHRGRGGICFEINGLLYDFLIGLGYCVRFIEARMVVDGMLREQANHMALLVVLDGCEYLVDPGDARGMTQPLMLNGKSSFCLCQCRHRVVNQGGNEFALELHQGESREIRYVFKTEPRSRQDFHRALYFIQYDPESVFHQKLIVTRMTGAGRLSLSEESLTLAGEKGWKQSFYLSEERSKILKERFLLEMGPGQA